MSIPNADEFLKKIATDSELRLKVKAALENLPVAEVPGVLAKLAGKQGFAVTEEDLTQDFKKPMAEAELDQVAGGNSAYASWLANAASQSESAAAQAHAAAGAFEAAFAGTVSPPSIAANRSTLATLIASNFFGQNAPAVGATESAFGEMWAQDAGSMTGYKP